MWIRTQGKEKLIKVKSLTLSRMWKYDCKGDESIRYDTKVHKWGNDF